ncbi:MAG: DUF1707 domain-containing protein [Actinomycetota bacterium]|nr:DUF1707 domain-containing protein [Actinomycetota bacterium]
MSRTRYSIGDRTMYEHHSQQPRPPWYAARPQPSTPSTPPGEMRISDAERAEVTNALCRHVADGRLDEAEFNDRAARATAAKTRDDLAPLLIDLPPLDGPTPEVPEHRPRRHLGWAFLGVLAVLAVGWSITAAATSVLHPHVPWVLFLIVAFFILRRRRHRHGYHRHEHG